MTLRIRDMIDFDSPSVWNRAPVTVAYIDFDEREHDRSLLLSALPALLAGLPAPAPAATPLTCLPSAAGGDLAGIIALLAINLQRLAGQPVTWWHAETGLGDDPDVIAFEHKSPEVGRAACELAIRIVDHLLSPTDSTFDAVSDYRSWFEPIVRRHWFPITTQLVIDAAEARGIPVCHVDPRQRFVELGTGVWRRRISGTVTSLLSLMGDEISTDKELTKSYLRAAGLPVFDSQIVTMVEHAHDAARRLGFPVVLKPVDGAAMAGVFLNVTSHEELERCFPASIAKSGSGRVLVERYLRARRYRLVFVGGEIVSVLHYEPAHVVGDGVHTIQQLIDIANANPRVGLLPSDSMRPITVDDEVHAWLDKQSLSLADIPAKGRYVRFRERPSIDDGGLTIDHTDEIHPHNAAIARQAVKILNLDVATMDVMAEDISRSLWETDGAILEINTYSGFRTQLVPSVGQPRNPGPAIVDMLFPPGTPIRVPVIAVAGDQAAAIAELIYQVLLTAGHSAGLACGDRLGVNGIDLHGVHRPGVQGVRTLFNNPEVEIVVTEVTAEGIVLEGLGFGYCDVAVVTSLSGMRTPFGDQVETILTGVLEPAGTLVMPAAISPQFAYQRHPERIWLSGSFDDPGVLAHLAAGGSAVGIDRQTPVAELIAATAGASRRIGRAPATSFEDERAVLTAIAAAIAANVPTNAISTRLTSVSSGETTS